jgi:branched-chain amino acid transport system substrate-binding protein
MTFLNCARRLAAIGLAAAVLGALTPAARAAEPYEINVILSLTGPLAFIGNTQVQSLKALGGYLNKNGGINGRPVSFVFSDDQSMPTVSLQLAQGLIAKHVPIIMGPSGPDTCAAITPVVAQNGPVLYCLANAGHPPIGSYVFLTLVPAEAMMGAVVRYLHGLGLNKIAYIVSTDASGQDAERAFIGAAAESENKAIQIVSRQHFATTDLSVAAQMAEIKAANPDAVIAWSAGTPAGTLFHGLRDAGIDLPTVTSPGNLNAAFFKQFGSITPKNLYFAGMPYYGLDTLTNPATKAANATMINVLAGVGARPDQIEISAWDPAMMLVNGLRKFGADATAAQLRSYLVNLKGWVGVNGPYDFPTLPQRGLGQNSVVVVRWDPDKNGAAAVSKLGGAPLPANGR